MYYTHCYKVSEVNAEKFNTYPIKWYQSSGKSMQQSKKVKSHGFQKNVKSRPLSQFCTVSIKLLRPVF